MPISKLPESMTRMLQSTLSITKPTSVVKELLDNAIDAGASSVEILISPNTIDKIQVKDNGRGIAPADFNALGRRSYTSKLRTLEELMYKGGSTLGFRGDALASMNAVGSVSITTRTGAEKVATVLELISLVGGSVVKAHTAAPVGTSVCVTQLFDQVKVRKEMAIRDRQKTMSEIKDLLHRYAFARPYIRLSLRVFHKPGCVWTLAPAQDIRDVTRKIFGESLCAQCLSLGPEKEDAAEAQADKFVFRAFLPRPDADFKVISGKGAFISVDGRPVTASGGVTRKLVSVFRESIKNARGGEAPTNAFIQLEVTCSPGAYDANIEAGKSDVLFADEKALLKLWCAVCENTYNRAEIVAADTDTSAELKNGSGNTAPEDGQNEYRLSPYFAVRENGKIPHIATDPDGGKSRVGVLGSVFRRDDNNVESSLPNDIRALLTAKGNGIPQRGAARRRDILLLTPHESGVAQTGNKEGEGVRAEARRQMITASLKSPAPVERMMWRTYSANTDDNDGCPVPVTTCAHLLALSSWRRPDQSSGVRSSRQTVGGNYGNGNNVGREGEGIIMLNTPPGSGNAESSGTRKMGTEAVNPWTIASMHAVTLEQQREMSMVPGGIRHMPDDGANVSTAGDEPSAQSSPHLDAEPAAEYDGIFDDLEIARPCNEPRGDLGALPLQRNLGMVNEGQHGMRSPPTSSSPRQREPAAHMDGSGPGQVQVPVRTMHSGLQATTTGARKNPRRRPNPTYKPPSSTRTLSQPGSARTPAQSRVVLPSGGREVSWNAGRREVRRNAISHELETQSALNPADTQEKSTPSRARSPAGNGGPVRGSHEQAVSGKGAGVPSAPLRNEICARADGRWEQAVPALHGIGRRGRSCAPDQNRLCAEIPSTEAEGRPKRQVRLEWNQVLRLCVKDVLELVKVFDQTGAYPRSEPDTAEGICNNGQLLLLGAPDIPVIIERLGPAIMERLRLMAGGEEGRSVSPPVSRGGIGAAVVD